MVPLAREAPNA